jgi:hypothetical protein
MASTAALETSDSRSLTNQRRAPHHPARERKSKQVTKQRRKARVRMFEQAQTAILKEDAMNGITQYRGPSNLRKILPVILRITFSLILWTLGFASMNLVQAQAKPQRTVKEYPADRAKLEHLQRWVNEGHDTWCRDPKLVASAALSRVAPELASYKFELTSMPLEQKKARGTKFVYTFATLDGRTTYRITLRRYHWLLPVAGTLDQMVWAPVRLETRIGPATD